MIVLDVIEAKVLSTFDRDGQAKAARNKALSLVKLAFHSD